MSACSRADWGGHPLLTTTAAASRKARPSRAGSSAAQPTCRARPDLGNCRPLWGSEGGTPAHRRRVRRAPQQ
eukprot:scaffold17869_cov104-Isochrysis_galbana.AAC.9